jgi:polysaccharide export outer membrane protein
MGDAMISTGSLFLAIWLCLSCVQEQDAKKPAVEAPSTKTPPSAPAKLSEAEYKIGPQDMLQIDVWKEPEITRTIPVRPDGKISLPLLNDVQAAGLTSLELAATIREDLKKYINNPQVTVTVMAINSRRVYVTGEAGHPGALPLLPNMTALQALSSSGGLSQFAKVKSIYILRQEGGKQVKLPFNYKEVVAGKKPDILLQPGDVIVVP